MSEQDSSPETNTNSPKSPPNPEKRFSLSKIIENIILFTSGIIFIASLFSKDKDTENKALPIGSQEENKEASEESEQQQKNKKKRTESTSSNPECMSKSRRLSSNANEKTKGKLHKKIFNDIYKAISLKLLIKVLAPFVVFFVLFTITGHWTNLLNGISPALKYLFSENIPLGVSISAAIVVALSLIFGKLIVTQLQKRISSLTNKYFISTLAALALLGGATALIIPSYTNLFREPGYTSAQQDSTKENPEKVQITPTPTASPTGNKAAEVEQKSTSDLRLHLLYVTGGIIAILGLIETNRKNSQDHIRQVHAARRDRYIEAVDKLSSDNAPLRLGGVYALVGLVDEWLDDDNIDEEIRLKEGQVIVNNLCSYIRSPFILAEKREIIEAVTSPYVYSGNLNEDKAKLREEQDIRRAIFIEMSKRCSTVKRKKGNVTVITWSDFNFDFTRAPIFYALNDINIEKPDFSDSTFYGNANFSGTNFIQDTKFIGAKFTQDVDFCRADFIGNADFRSANFPGFAEFKNVKFRKDINFSGIVFKQSATFREARFYGVANFVWTLFKNSPERSQEADFTKAKFFQGASFYGTIFETNANFEDAKFLKNAKFSRLDFRKATFGPELSSLKGTSREDIIKKRDVSFMFFLIDDLNMRIADFGYVVFEKKANFKNAILGPEADSDQIIDFCNTEFKQGADFICTTFNYDTYFNNSTFEKEEGYNQNVNFFSATFRRNTYFIRAVFKLDADFRVQIFGQEVDFNLARFSGITDFSGVIFKDYAGFSEATFETSPPKFVYTIDPGVSYPAKFVAISDPYNSHDFDVDANKGNHTIDTGITTYKGIDYRVPKGTVVFEYPEDWDEAQQEPINYSSPAK